MKMCGQMWNQMTEDQKKPYFELSENDKIRYHQEKEKSDATMNEFGK